MEHIIQQKIQTEMAALLNAVPQVHDDEPTLSPEPSANATVTLDAIAKLIDEKLNNARIKTQQSNEKPTPHGTIDGTPVTYCWSHGITANLFHDSKTCRRCKTGHKKEATLNNRMGGSDIHNKRRDT